MTSRFHLHPSLAALTAAALAGCTFTSLPPAPTTTAGVSFPYPPQHDILEIAVPLDPHLTEVARFALEADLASVRSVHGDPDYVLRYQTTIAKGLWHPSNVPPIPGLRTTGGDTYRAVRATAGADGQVEVDVCSYSVPGVYGIDSLGRKLSPNPNPTGYALSRMTIEKTTAESADGARPTEPRWLVVNDWIKVALNPDETYRVCGPFKPNPWVQKMPDPTAPPTTPTTTAPGK